MTRSACRSKAAIANTAVELARQRLAPGDRAPHDIETPFTLVVPESTGK